MRAKEKEMAYHLELKRFELASLNNNNNNNIENEKIDLKKFPQFRKGDCPKAFLIYFERVCWDFNVKAEERMVILMES